MNRGGKREKGKERKEGEKGRQGGKEEWHWYLQPPKQIWILCSQCLSQAQEDSYVRIKINQEFLLASCAPIIQYKLKCSHTKELLTGNKRTS